MIESGMRLATPGGMETKPMKRILVATDFSEGSDNALSTAITLAKALDATLDLVHVLDVAMQAFPLGLGVYEENRASVYAEVDRALTTRADQVRQAGVVCQTDSLDGHPPGEIVRHAKTAGADLIVVGTHGRTGIAHVVLGSVAERVVQRSPCPVLAVPFRP
jgi:universal stress protein A